jgi:uncharacterized protein (TIGR02996 family)
MTTTHATADALLRAVCDDPGDDLPRLAFADHLEETGGDPARAEFVRVQVELAARGCVDVWCEKVFRENYPIGRRCELADGCDALRERERQLLALDFVALGWHGAGWPRRVTAAWRRGFVASVTLPCDDWLAHGPALVRAQPITGVTLADREPWLNFAGEYGWSPLDPSDDRPQGRAYLPAGLYDALPDPDHVRPPIGTWETRARALTALSTACVTWARREAGMPDLPPAPG